MTTDSHRTAFAKKYPWLVQPEPVVSVVEIAPDEMLTAEIDRLRRALDKQTAATITLDRTLREVRKSRDRWRERAKNAFQTGTGPETYSRMYARLAKLGKETREQARVIADLESQVAIKDRIIAKLRGESA